MLHEEDDSNKPYNLINLVVFRVKSQSVYLDPEDSLSQLFQSKTLFYMP